jgi:hypothetical protein
MRRTIFLALLAALLIAPAARATPPVDIQRDCADDGVLQHDYSVSDLRRARAELPTDADEYGDCRDVLTRAISKAIAASKTPTPTPTTSGADSGGSDDSGSTGSSTGGSTGGSGNTGGGSPSTDTSQDQQDDKDAATLAAPSSPQDQQAVGAAQAAGEQQIKAELVARSPDQERLAASIGRNGLPATMIAVLVLIVATLVAALLPLIRRRRDLPEHPGT